MNTYLIYGIILIILVTLELLYFKIADHFNIIDKPNERSSHSSIVRRGGGVIFLLGVWLWYAFFGFHYPLYLAAVTLAAGVSFINDVHSLPDSVRLLAQFAAIWIEEKLMPWAHDLLSKRISLDSSVLCMAFLLETDSSKQT